MESFVHKLTDKITGTLSCFDRIIFKGYLPFTYPQSMEGLLYQKGILIKDFPAIAHQQSILVKDHAQALAEKSGRPFIPLDHRLRKEDEARKIIQRDKLTEGLVCVFSTQENSPSFQIVRGQGRPRLKRSRPHCLVLYFYYLDPEFGLIHIRLPTWFPFSIQVYVNGHAWLAHQLDRYQIVYQRRDNAFLFISDCGKAQALADQLKSKKWHRFLSALARRVNPLLGGFLKGCRYSWFTDQAEYALDIMFKDRASLGSLYPRLLQHAQLQLSAEDILSFLGKKLAPQFQGELTGELKKRLTGFRVKHCYHGNWMKMYDKFAQVLRVEMVINRPRCFYVLRWTTRHGKPVFGSFCLLKNVRYLGRYAEISSQATHRYLDALAVVADPHVGQRVLDRVCNRVSYHKGRRRALNPLSHQDQKLFTAVLRGEHSIRGFYSRDIAKHLDLPPTRDPQEKRRRSSRIGRLLQLLRAHGLLIKLPHTRRYRVTKTGLALMSAAIEIRHKTFPDKLTDAA